MSSDEKDQPTPNDEGEKGLTFRKRRLSLPMHRVQEAQAAVADVQNSVPIPSTVDTDGVDETGIANATPTSTATSEHHDAETDVSPLYDEKEKSRTFRKRRLSVTANQNHDTTPMAADFEIALKDVDGDEGSAFKRRRMSDVSHGSGMSTSTAGSMSRSRVHHAGEIIRHPQSPSNRDPNNRLYIGPHNLDQYQPEAKQPIWKRRMTRTHSDDERKLPFPRSVVGLYSCHGIEPLYARDFVEHEDDDEDNEDDDTWLNDISPEQKGQPLSPRQPKMTTSAKINQDRGGIAFPYGDTPKTALFAVYDGHGQGGELVSQYSLYHVQQKLKRHPNFKDDLEKAFKETFIKVDEELSTEPSIEPLYAGTTACAALLRDNVLTLSNAGDSRAVLARLKTTSDSTTTSTTTNAWETIPLTVDQNPDHPDEKARIERYGGYVSPPPEPGLSARVWLDSSCSQIGLAMARSIGDHAVKPVGVIAEPVVTSHTITKDDDFVILASDGVWEFISSEEAVEIVGSHLFKGASLACQALIEAAANRWHEEEGDYRDDITALVIRLQNLWDAVEGRSKRS
ncbi:Sigma factor PP2C-like phosphatase [Fragilaria crotonensis]|nr:Sigma factor PP2C-like phosphatase [Fragilaria crotonensis]